MEPVDVSDSRVRHALRRVPRPRRPGARLRNSRRRFDTRPGPVVELPPRPRQHEEADEVRNRARVDANELQRRAAEEAERTLADTVGRRRAIDHEMRQLEEARDRMLDRLAELGDELRRSVARYRNGTSPSSPTQPIDVQRLAPAASALPGRARATGS